MMGSVKAKVSHGETKSENPDPAADAFALAAFAGRSHAATGSSCAHRDCAAERQR
jgi:hypothetical protein